MLPLCSAATKAPTGRLIPLNSSPRGVARGTRSRGRVSLCARSPGEPKAGCGYKRRRPEMELHTQVLHTSPERVAVMAENARGRQVEALLTQSKEGYDGEMLAMRADELP